MRVELRVALEFCPANDNSRQWLRVTNNSVGIYSEFIESNLSHIGTSYYRSPKLNQEGAAIKAAGEVVSSINWMSLVLTTSACFWVE